MHILNKFSTFPKVSTLAKYNIVDNECAPSKHDASALVMYPLMLPKLFLTIRHLERTDVH